MNKLFPRSGWVQPIPDNPSPEFRAQEIAAMQAGHEAYLEFIERGRRIVSYWQKNVMAPRRQLRVVPTRRVK